jgi:glycosyltransferase involved in cell wall biosynthesis
MQPFVSVLTPTYNRRKFIPSLIKIYEAQTYPKNRMEWIILDDGEEKVGDLFEAASKRIPNIRYYSYDDKMLIGKKRNMLNDLAKGEIIIAMDDDDYYPPDRIKHTVYKLNQFPKVELAGSSEIYLFYTDTKKVHRFGPINQNHATNGTLAYKRSYLKGHKYDETVKMAEEKSFLDEYKNPMVQLDPHKTMLVMCHTSNTFSKSEMRYTNPLMKETTMKIKDFIKDAQLREFFTNA